MWTYPGWTRPHSLGISTWICPNGLDTHLDTTMVMTILDGCIPGYILRTDGCIHGAWIHPWCMDTSQDASMCQWMHPLVHGYIPGCIHGAWIHPRMHPYSPRVYLDMTMQSGYIHSIFQLAHGYIHSVHKHKWIYPCILSVDITTSLVVSTSLVISTVTWGPPCTIAKLSLSKYGSFLFRQAWI